MIITIRALIDKCLRAFARVLVEEEQICNDIVAVLNFGQLLIGYDNPVRCTEPIVRAKHLSVAEIVRRNRERCVVSTYDFSAKNDICYIVIRARFGFAVRCAILREVCVVKIHHVATVTAVYYLRSGRIGDDLKFCVILFALVFGYAVECDIFHLYAHAFCACVWIERRIVIECKCNCAVRLRARTAVICGYTRIDRRRRCHICIVVCSARCGNRTPNARRILIFINRAVHLETVDILAQNIRPRSVRPRIFVNLRSERQIREEHLAESIEIGVVACVKRKEAPRIDNVEIAYVVWIVVCTADDCADFARRYARSERNAVTAICQHVAVIDGEISA